MRGRLVLCACAAGVLLAAAPAPAGASDMSVMSTFVTWTTRFGTDADRQAQIANAAPLSTSMRTATSRVHLDAVHAVKALRHQRPATKAGRRARVAAIDAFATYASAEHELLLHLDATRHHNAAAGIRHFARARTRLARGARLLQRAATLAGRLR